jgi:hypothetical protein
MRSVGMEEHWAGLGIYLAIHSRMRQLLGSTTSEMRTVRLNRNRP